MVFDLNPQSVLGVPRLIPATARVGERRARLCGGSTAVFDLLEPGLHRLLLGKAALPLAAAEFVHGTEARLRVSDLHGALKLKIILVYHDARAVEAHAAKGEDDLQRIDCRAGGCGAAIGW